MLLQRSARRESSAQARHSSQTGGDVNAIVFHSQHKPKTGSRKLLNDFQTANW